MIQGGVGGGNTITGLIYEAEVDLVNFLNSQKGYVVKDMDIFYNEELVGNVFKKHGLYKFLTKKELIGRIIYQKDFYQIIVFMSLWTIQLILLKLNFRKLREVSMKNYKLVILRKNNI